MHATDAEILEIVDADDRVVGTSTRAEIHRRGLLHRAVHVFVFNTQGDVYVQRRSASKDRHPLKLDSSAAGHVDPGETYEQTAARELQEELGLHAPLERIVRIPASERTDSEHVMLFKAVTDEEPTPNAEEILSGGFVPPDRLSEMMQEDPHDFVHAFMLLWHVYRGTDEGVSQRGAGESA
jgi:isopentenyl-diphosphate Delta-isomerase